MSEEEVTTNVEDEARNLGWVPEEEWTGPEGKWKPAEEFVGAKEHALHDNKILQNRISKMESDTIRMREMMEAQHQRELDALRRQLDERERKAVSEADVEEFNAVQAEKKAMEAPQSTVDPIIQDFISRNEWFNSDPTKRAKAIGLDAQYRSMGMSPAEYLPKIEEEMNKKPILPKTNPSVNTPGPKAPKKDTFASLSPQDKAFYDRQVKLFKRHDPNFKEDDYKKQFLDHMAS